MIRGGGEVQIACRYSRVRGARVRLEKLNHVLSYGTRLPAFHQLAMCEMEYVEGVLASIPGHRYVRGTRTAPVI